MKEKNKKDAPSEGPITQSWHAMSVDDVLDRMELDSSVLSHGLTSAEAKERLEKFGPNKMTEATKKTLCQHIYAQVANLLVFILAVVAVVSAVRAATATDADTVITSTIQVGLIVGVIVINTIIGVWQEGSAEAAAEALRNMLSADACVMRDGKEVQIPSTEVVPGDHVIISAGDKVPADLRLFTVFNLACGEAALTRESVPIDKTVAAIAVKSKPESTPLGDRHNMAFSATLVAEGRGAGIAIATGDDTQIGTINALVSTVEEKKTNVLQQIDFISKWLAIFILLCTLTTFLIALLKTGIPAMDALSISLVCAVGMIPEGLAAIVTMTYAWAVSNMAKQNAIIRALPAVETLGSVTVICSDKTGTLTQNKMSVVAFVTSNAHYRVDVNAKVRSPDSFVRSDSYLSVRAGHLADAPLKEVVEDGPNTNTPRRGKVAASNHFAITNLEKPPPSMHVEPSMNDTDYENLPVADGDSPDLQFIKSAFAGGILCSHCVLGVDGTRDGEIGNPTEISILRAAYNAGVDVEGLKEKNPIVAQVPFGSAYKFMSTIHEPAVEIDGEGFDNQYIVHVKGAPDSMLSLCNTQAKAGLIGEIEPIRRTYWTEQIAILSSHGLRVLALTRAVVPQSEVKAGDQLGPEFINRHKDTQWLTMVGLCGIQDPPRPECIDAIVTAHNAGVRVAMITGDHKDTAIAIGTILGIVDDRYPSGITGPELDEMDEDQLKEAVMTYNVFARSSPQNKLQIVKALQAQQQVASMTGDGVNDAPSLKQADMGVAMGLEGTDVAREASDMILADDNFATIVVAVREGRVVWDNLRKVIHINTCINNAQGMSVLFGLALGLPQTPLTSIQVLFSNLICAVTLGFACAIEPAEDGIMDMPPRRVGKRLVGRYLFLRVVLGTFILILVIIVATFWAKNSGYDLDHQRSIAFNVLDFGAISICLSARFSYNSSIHARVFRGNVLCWWSVLIVAVLQVAITYIPGLNSIIFNMAPMDGAMWLVTFIGMVITFLVMEAEKAFRRYLRKLGSDTDDREKDSLFDEEVVRTSHLHLPKGASRLGLEELKS
ncbi:Cation transport ATPase [Fragilaria crotonensis]|nr:Cation transport ATPase [Fragilaria crotonensis]